jgi:4-methyl-5(b-hydroxyethyl)-thiazole monophosphate biosynthesis
VLTDSVVCDGNIITSRGMGTAIDFGLYILGYFTDDATVDKVRKSLVYNK